MGRPWRELGTPRPARLPSHGGGAGVRAGGAEGCPEPCRRRATAAAASGRESYSNPGDGASAAPSRSRGPQAAAFLVPPGSRLQAQSSEAWRL